MEIVKVYLEGYNTTKPKAYEYIPYHTQRFTERGKALFLADFIPDPPQRLRAMQKALEIPKNANRTYLLDKDKPKKNDVFKPLKTPIQTEKEFKKYSKRGLFFKTSAEQSKYNALALQIYLDNIFANIPTTKPEFEQIEYLVQSAFKWHRGILYNTKVDFVLQPKYNEILFACFTKKIHEITTTPTTPIQEQIQSKLNQSLLWNANVSTLGTLFAEIHKTGAIKGTKKDLIRALCAMFPNVNKNTLENAIYKKESIGDLKVHFDHPATIELKPFISHLANTLLNKKTKPTP